MTIVVVIMLLDISFCSVDYDVFLLVPWLFGESEDMAGELSEDTIVEIVPDKESTSTAEDAATGEPVNIGDSMVDESYDNNEINDVDGGSSSEIKEQTNSSI